MRLKEKDFNFHMYPNIRNLRPIMENSQSRKNPISLKVTFEIGIIKETNFQAIYDISSSESSKESHNLRKQHLYF